MVSKNFVLQEFIDPATFAKYGKNSIWFIDKRVIYISQVLRDIFGPITINNWHDGGTFKLSGFRPGSEMIGASMSQHKYGRAADLKFKNQDPEEIRIYIEKNFDTFKNYGLTTIELNTPTWLHFDCRQTNLNYLFKVKYQ